MEREVLDVSLKAASLITPLGVGVDANVRQMRAGATGLRVYAGEKGWPETYCASVIPESLWAIGTEKWNLHAYRKFDRLMLWAAHEALADFPELDPTAHDVQFILSTTKGNIDVADQGHASWEEVYLWHSAAVMAAHFRTAHPVRVVSQACISGLAAAIWATDMIRNGRCRHTVVIGADVISRFVLSGFHCLKALSPIPCKPFDKERAGLNLGEAGAAMVLGPASGMPGEVLMVTGGTNDDAHHISAPARDAQGLYELISRIMRKHPCRPDFINTHGTATLFNDQMEALAISRCGLADTPVMSYKAWFGHTLGASGLLDAVLCAASLERNLLFPSRGFDTLGVSESVHIQPSWSEQPLHCCLKTASGFGGCNGALIMEKEEGK